MAETLVNILVIVFMVICVGALVLFAATIRKTDRRIRLLDLHIDCLFRSALQAADAYHRVRNNGSAEERLALDRAMSQLAAVAESARKREEIE